MSEGTKQKFWTPMRVLLIVAVLVNAVYGVLRLLGAPSLVLEYLGFFLVVAWVIGLLLRRWKTAWPAYVTAVLYVFMFPHLGLGFLGFVCFVPLLDALLATDDRKRAMRLGWVAGLVALTGKLYWIVYTISYFSPIPAAAAVLILLLMTSFIALSWLAAFVTTHWAVKTRGLPLWLVFPVAWVFWDWSWTWILGGFPWELLGCAAFRIPLLKQTFDLVGEHGLGWLLAFGNVVFFHLWQFARKKELFPKAQTAVLVALVAAGMIYGAVRTGQIEQIMSRGETVTVGLLQGNVDQSIKWKPDHRLRIMDEYEDMAVHVAEQGAELIIFPETAIARRQQRWRHLHPEIARYAEVTERYVLTGVPVKDIRKNREDPRGPFTSHNSAVLVSPEGEDIAWYDKNRLVPFGEYIPKKHWLQRLAGQEIRGTLNFEPSGIYKLMPFPRAPFSVFICYEAVYPTTVRRLTNLGAKFLVTITNDAWFGKTSAPYQHWDQVAMRAVENRRYVARAANTGISGIIDPLGRTIKATDIYVPATYVGTVKTLDIRTVYATIGDVAAYVAAVIYAGILLFLAIGAVRRRKEKTK